MSIRTAIVVRLARIAKFFVERRKAALYGNINNNGKEFRKTHEERRDSLRLANENYIRAIKRAAELEELEKQEASRIAEARTLRLADQESDYRADLYELTELDA